MEYSIILISLPILFGALLSALGAFYPFWPFASRVGALKSFGSCVLLSFVAVLVVSIATPVEPAAQNATGIKRLASANIQPLPQQDKSVLSTTLAKTHPTPAAKIVVNTEKTGKSGLEGSSAERTTALSKPTLPQAAKPAETLLARVSYSNPVKTDAGDEPKANLVTDDKADLTTEAEKPEPAAAVPPKPKKKAGRSMYVSASGLIVRSRPKKNSRKVTTLRRNQQVSVVGRSGNWRRVRGSGYDGWVYKKYLTARKARARVSQRGLSRQ